MQHSGNRDMFFEADILKEAGILKTAIKSACDT